MTDALTRMLLAAGEALERDDLAGAVTAFESARTMAPSNASIALALANAHRLRGDVLRSRETLLDAHRHADLSDVADAHALGAALLETGSPVEAADCFSRVVQACPRDGGALAALAGAMRTAGDAAGAWPIVHRAIAASPDLPAVMVTASQVRHDLGDLRGALKWLDRAEALRPGHAATQLHRAYTMMMAGPSRAGWEQFESRPLPVPSTSARAWPGDAPDAPAISIEGASVLVTGEQGVGDQFQFLRFVPLLVARGATRVVVECHADAVSLLRANGFDAVPRGQPPETDWHVPMLSLPHRLGLHDDVLAQSVPYLRADAIGAREVSAGSTRRIGLVWAGNPAFTGRATRDLDLSLLPEITAIPDVEWVSLQHGAAGDIELPGVTRAAPRDWMDTARILAGLDGLVSTDTGILHLAGAMGVRTWAMLQAVPDWRWGLSGSTSAWYPSVTLLRPERPGDWRSVLHHLSEALLHS